MTDRKLLREAILSTLKVKGSRVLSARELTSRLRNRAFPDVEREQIEEVLDELESEGLIVAIRGRRFSLPEYTPYVTGTFRSRSDGSGIITSFSHGEKEELFVSRSREHEAMHGDTVMARVERKSREKRTAGGMLPQARIVRVISRAHDTVVGRFHAGDPPWVRPFDTRIDTDVNISGETMEAQDGQMVEAEITTYPGRTGTAVGTVIDVLGYIWEKGVDVEIVLRKYRIPRLFDEEVLEEAEAIDLTVSESETEGRIDLRDRTIVTIDGETARDFDDAVDVRITEKGNFVLGVHIADVSHYVRPGTKLDEEAWTRGTSVYFPGRVVPMLPERLSNGICSLNPDEDRLTFTAEMEFDQKGRMIGRKFFRSVIRSSARLTYTEVNAVLDGESRELAGGDQQILEAVQRLEPLYRLLRQRRASRGSIDFDLPQHEVLLTEEGDIDAIRSLERNDAHRLIEEFMLAANEAVASELYFSDQPALYRNHPRPELEKLEELRELLSEVGYKLRGDLEEIRPAALRKVLEKIEGTPEERFINEVVLRSMARASYEPECEGHFALAIEQYTHFTSPIRRYPDLVVHRMLGRLLTRGVLHGDERETVARDLEKTAEQASMTERRAERAEREVLEWKKVIFMLDRVGEEYSGFITGVAPFGLFVELDDFFVQGMVPVATIGGDFWVYVEAEHRLRGRDSARELKLGDPVTVRVEEVDEDRQQIELRLVSLKGEAIKEAKRAPRGPRGKR